MKIVMPSAGSKRALTRIEMMIVIVLIARLAAWLRPQAGGRGCAKNLMR